MTFVDLVFPAFLFIVGMSIPRAVGARLAKGHSRLRLLAHVGVRTLSLLWIGILMVHETPNSVAMGWSGHWWCVLMYLSAIAAFCSFSPSNSALPTSRRTWRTARTALLGVRLAGLAALVWLAFAFRGSNGQHIISLSPFSLDPEWYGILGLIGWAYLVTSIVFLTFHNDRAAMLGCMALLMCLFVADRSGLFERFWLNHLVSIGTTLGSLAAIAVGGLLLGSKLATGDLADWKAGVRFTLWFVAGCSAAALLLNRAYGISKNAATPSWCFWACAITATLWYVFHLIADARPGNLVARPLELAGQNVLLAYLLSEMLPNLLEALRLSDGYGRLAATLPLAITRSALCGLIVLSISIGLNRLGLRIKL